MRADPVEVCLAVAKAVATADAPVSKGCGLFAISRLATAEWFAPPTCVGTEEDAAAADSVEDSAWSACWHCAVQALESVEAPPLDDDGQLARVACAVICTLLGPPGSSHPRWGSRWGR